MARGALVHPAAVVSASPHACPKYDTEMPRVGLPFPPHPTGAGHPLFAWPRVPRFPGEGATSPVAGGHPQADGPGSAPLRCPWTQAPTTHHPTATGTYWGYPIAPPPANPTESLLPSPLLHRGCPKAVGGCGDPQPWVCPLPAHAEPLPGAKRGGCESGSSIPSPSGAQHQPGWLKVKRRQRGKPRCLPQTPNLSSRMATYGLGGDTGRVRAWLAAAGCGDNRHEHAASPLALTLPQDSSGSSAGACSILQFSGRSSSPGREGGRDLRQTLTGMRTSPGTGEDPPLAGNPAAPFLVHPIPGSVSRHTARGVPCSRDAAWVMSAEETLSLLDESCHRHAASRPPLPSAACPTSHGCLVGVPEQHHGET